MFVSLGVCIAALSGGNLASGQIALICQLSTTRTIVNKAEDGDVIMFFIHYENNTFNL